MVITPQMDTEIAYRRFLKLKHKSPA
jgi:hypothetical protein